MANDTDMHSSCCADGACKGGDTVNNVEEITKALRRIKTLKIFGNDHTQLMGDAADALTELQAENKSLRNELCCKCRQYREAHNGACDGCKWGTDNV